MTRLIELLGESASNSGVGIIDTSNFRVQLLAGLLLAVFSLQAAEKMPCHGDTAFDAEFDDGLDQFELLTRQDLPYRPPIYHLS